MWELTRGHRFPLGTIFTFWPYGTCCPHLVSALPMYVASGWGLLMASTSAASDPPRPETICILACIFAVVTTLLHSGICVLSDISDTDFARQIGG